jgi:hypothetical protein
MRERDIENYLRKEVKKRGGHIRKLKWIGRRGAPDDLVWIQGWDFPKLVEMKRPGKKLEAHQRRERLRLIKMGIESVKLDTLKDIDKFLGLR